MLMKVNGIEAPENMTRCMNNCYDLEGFWKGWHSSYNRYLVRWIRMFKISIWKKAQTRFCSLKGTCKCFQIDVVPSFERIEIFWEWVCKNGWWYSVQPCLSFMPLLLFPLMISLTVRAKKQTFSSCSLSGCWAWRYLYIPLGGSKWRLINVWIIFTFVAIWHDLEWWAYDITPTSLLRIFCLIFWA